MVDFKKRLGKKEIQKIVNPCDIYETLDRASDKGPLRPVQNTILSLWYSEYSQNKDVILKLHTGQGKTLIGLLILQSKINQNQGPALYLCPDNYLVQQTCDQADSFGINYCVTNGELPDNFLDGKSIFITNINKLFNGQTKFKLGAKSLKVSSIVMDDAHACIESIKESYIIGLSNDSQPYQEILSIFGLELESQGVGTYADIKNNEYDAFLAVPYWDWYEKYADVAKVLSNNKQLNEIKFAWPILKDMLRDCKCIISGTNLEISPYMSPLHMFGSYFNAEHRVFMSATINDDSFFIKGLGLHTDTIKNPLMIPDEKWSGEKMIIIPSLIDDSLNRTEVVNFFAKPKENRKLGVVAMVPSFNRCADWEKYGSTLAKKETIISEVEKLKNKVCDKTLVISNRYNGIDLPDHSCRVLIFDSLPYAESLEDRHLDNCRSNSDITAIKLAQTIEQGLGRSVRGEKDYCAIILTGTELVKVVRNKDTKKFFSLQTRTQVDIGMKIADYAKDDIRNGVDPQKALINLINQLLKRDDGWKEFYTENMDYISNGKENKKILEIFEAEVKADNKYQEAKYQEAVEIIQSIIDKHITDEEEKGWYFQEMARYIYPLSKINSNEYQILAHKKNKYLFKPKEGMVITKIAGIGVKRIENIINWIRKFDSYEELKVFLDVILGNMRFGIDSDRFEKSIDDIAKALGFISQRPDKELNEGPDNLWKVNDNQYLLIECKNKVLSSRKEIYKTETGQMNNASAWFTKNYGDIPVNRIMIIPTKKISKGAGFNLQVKIMREASLKKFIKNINSFFMEFKELDLDDLSNKTIHKFLNFHHLSVDEILTLYSEDPVG